MGEPAPDPAERGQTALLYVGVADAVRDAVASLGARGDRFRVETAASAGEALDRLAEAAADCVVCEDDLPDAEGTDLAAAVEERADVPVVLVVGGDAGGVEAAADAAVTDFVRASSADSPAVLATRIENAVDSHRAPGLAAEKDQYRRLFEEAPVMYATTSNRAGKAVVENCNRTFLEALGYDREAVVGEPLSRFYTEASAAALREGGYDEALAGEFGTEERAFRTADGERIETLLRAVPRTDGGDGEVVGTLTLYVDITDRKRRERELERYETIVETIDDVAFVVDEDWTVDYVNPTVEEYVETVAGDLEGQPVMGLADGYATDPGDVDRFEAALERAFEAGDDPRPERVEMTLSVADGDVTFEYQLSPVAADGRVPAVVVTMRDVTRRKERERELSAAKERLERQNDRLETFASVVSHDLRNPLDVARGRLELAREDCDSDHLDSMERAFDRMDELIEDLLTLARQEGAETNPRRVRLDRLARECWLEREGATLSVAADRTVRADETRLRQLLDNLFSNAVEHGSTADDDALVGEVAVTFGILGDDEGFYVEDDGPGVPPAERDRVFESGYTTSASGTGIGLAIVEAVAGAHGWDIALTDGADGGARFEVRGVEFVD